MSERDRAMAIAMLSEGFGVKELTPARVRIYSQALEDVPPAVLDPMVQRAIKTRKPRWGDMPTVAELLEDAESCRKELLAALKFEKCDDCHGWTEVEVEGVKRLTRCQCWTLHQHKRAQLGVGDQPLALPAPEPHWTEQPGQ